MLDLLLLPERQLPDHPEMPFLVQLLAARPPLHPLIAPVELLEDLFPVEEALLPPRSFLK